jgi:peptide/nickel transport system substrate-binding protein
MAQPFAYRTAAGQQTLTRRRFLAISVASTVPGFVAGCGGSGDNRRSALATPRPAGTVTGPESPRPGGTITCYQVGNPPTLDPQRTTSYFTQQPAGAVYSRLLRFKTGPNPTYAEHRDVEGDLATKVESPDAATWIGTLRTGVAFHDIPPVSGHHVESEDVKLSFLRALDQQNPNRASLSMIDSIETPSRNTSVTGRLQHQPMRCIRRGGGGGCSGTWRSGSC